jgi:hypothetical protein
MQTPPCSSLPAASLSHGADPWGQREDTPFADPVVQSDTHGHAAALNAICRVSSTPATSTATELFTDMLGKLPQVEHLVRHSPLWCELQRQPNVLAGMVRYAYGGEACAHSAAFHVLCTEIAEACPAQPLAFRCVRQMLLAALMQSVERDSPRGEYLARWFNGLADRMKDRRLTESEFNAAMVRDCSALVRLTEAWVLSGAHRVTRWRLGLMGSESLAFRMPRGLVPDPAWVDEQAMYCVQRMRHICDRSRPGDRGVHRWLPDELGRGCGPAARRWHRPFAGARAGTPAGHRLLAAHGRARCHHGQAFAFRASGDRGGAREGR